MEPEEDQETSFMSAVCDVIDEDSPHLVPLETKKDVRIFLRGIVEVFVENVDIDSSGLHEELSNRGFLNSADQDSLKGFHLPTRGERARRLWEIMNEVDHRVFIRDVLPILRRCCEDIIPARFWGKGDITAAQSSNQAVHGEADACFRCAVRSRVRGHNMADFLFRAKMINTEEHRKICHGYRTGTTDWPYIFKVFKSASKVKIARHADRMRAMLETHSLWVPVNLEDIMKAGFPCTCQKKRAARSWRPALACWSLRRSLSSVSSSIPSLQDYPRFTGSKHDLQGSTTNHSLRDNPSLYEQYQIFQDIPCPSTSGHSLRHNQDNSLSNSYSTFRSILPSRQNSWCSQFSSEADSDNTYRQLSASANHLQCASSIFSSVQSLSKNYLTDSDHILQDICNLSYHHKDNLSLTDSVGGLPDTANDSCLHQTLHAGSNGTGSVDPMASPRMNNSASDLQIVSVSDSKSSEPLIASQCVSRPGLQPQEDAGPFHNDSKNKAPWWRNQSLVAEANEKDQVNKLKNKRNRMCKSVFLKLVIGCALVFVLWYPFRFAFDMCCHAHNTNATVPNITHII